MVKSGVKRWDEMPEKVGIADIDSMRAAYSIARDSLSRNIQRMNDLKKELDIIHNKWKKDGVKDEGIQNIND